MRIRFLLPALLLLSAGLTAAPGTDAPAPVPDILTADSLDRVYKDLKQRITVRHTPVPAEVAGVAAPRLSLNGTWLFHPKVKGGFQHRLPKAGTDGWARIAVPAEWELQGFKVGRDDWAGYARTFTLPDDWKDKRVLLRFGTVQSRCEVYLNGRLLTKHEGAMTSFEADATAAVRPGENYLAVCVKAYSLSETHARISHYAKHTVGGILRPVEAVALPMNNIASLVAHATLSEDLNEGTVRIEISANGPKEGRTYVVRLRERGIEGLTPAAPLRTVFETASADGTLAFTVPRPQLWHAETPFLYTLEVTLLDGGRPLQTVTRDLGFRRIDIRGNMLFVNGRRVRLRGTARHDIVAYRGRVTVSAEETERDLRQLRDANVNYIRTCHYPPSEAQMDAADRLGIFIEDEAPACWAQGSGNSVSEAASLFYCFRSLLERDHSHPSVLVWSTANESRWGIRYLPCLRLAREMTPHIPVKFSHSETNGIVWETDIGVKHYPGWKGALSLGNHFRPMLFSEALHINAYNIYENFTDPGLRDRWGDAIAYAMDHACDNPAIVGYGIWSCIDEIFHMPDGTVRGYGPWGVVDVFRRPKPEFWHMQMAYSPVSLPLTHALPEGDRTGVLTENRYSVRSDLHFRWKTDTRSGTADLTVAPGEKAVLYIPAPLGSNETLRLEAVDPRGFSMARWQLPAVAPVCVPMPELQAAGGTQVAESETDVTVTANGLTFRFVKNGAPRLTVSDSTGTLLDSPLCAYSIEAQPDYTNTVTVKDPDGRALWRSSPLADAALRSVTATKTETGVRIRLETACGRTRVRYDCDIDGTGCLHIGYCLWMPKTVGVIRQYGIGLNLPEAYRTLSWKRRGLWSVYPEDHIGRSEGTARAFYPETLSPWLKRRELPKHSWSHDGNLYGSNDFRSTKHNLLGADFTAPGRRTVRIESNGFQHLRAWVAQAGTTDFLLAHYSDAGSEHYLRYDTDRVRFLNPGITAHQLTGWLRLRFPEKR